MAKKDDAKKTAPTRRRGSSTKPEGPDTAPMSADATVQPADNGIPSHEIARRAYEIYQARGGRDGTAVEDWLQAERELADARRRTAD